MRSYLPAYDLKTVRDLPELLALMGTEPGVWRPFAGGTDLMVLFEAGKLSHKKFVSIWGLPELKGIEAVPSHVTLGALTTYSEILDHPVLRKEFPMLLRAAAETGAVAIQNRGTLGGNIVNASPAADSPPALLAYDAELELVSAKGSRWVRYVEFMLGYKKTVLQANEILVRVRIPRVSNAEKSFHYYRKVGTRKAQAISKVCFAGVATLSSGQVSEIRIAMGSVAPTPLRCLKTEAVLRGKKLDLALISHARAELSREIAPIDDIRSTAVYRNRVAENLLEEFLSQAQGQA